MEELILTNNLHNLVAEQALLGAIMQSPEHFSNVRDDLNVNDFYHPQHKLLYETMLALNAGQVAIDATTVMSKLSDYGRLAEVGGASYILAVFESVTALAHTEHYLKIVKDKSQRRSVINQANALIADVSNPEIDRTSAINTMSEQMQNLQKNDIDNSNSQNINYYLGGVIDKINNPTNKSRGLQTGYANLDHLLGGLKKSELIIIAARPSMGKSTFALNIARNVANHEKANVAFFSLEMTAEQLTQKLVDNLGSRNFIEQAKKGRMLESEKRSLEYAVKVASNLNIVIDETPSLEISQLRTRARRMHEKQPLQLIIVDYLQYVHCKDFPNNRVQEISKISRTLKEIARELEVPVIALSQLSRASEKRTDNLPLLSDLRDSGSIEQDADKVIMIHREDYYRKHGEPRDNLAELLVRKNRNGRTGSTVLRFNGDTSNFENINF